MCGSISIHNPVNWTKKSTLPHEYQGRRACYYSSPNNFFITADKLSGTAVEIKNTAEGNVLDVARAQRASLRTFLIFSYVSVSLLPKSHHECCLLL